MNAARLARVVAAARVVALAALLVWVVVASARAAQPGLVVLCGVAAAATLVFAQRWPVLAPAVATAALIVANTVGGLPEDGRSDSPFLLMLIWSAFLAGRHAAPRFQPWIAAIGLAFVAMVVSNPGIRCQ